LFQGLQLVSQVGPNQRIGFQNASFADEDDDMMLMLMLMLMRAADDDDDGGGSIFLLCL